MTTADRYWFGWAMCSTSGEPCPLDAGGTTTGPCNYDPVAGERCACTDEWGCNDDFPGLEFIMLPQSCLPVCG